MKNNRSSSGTPRKRALAACKSRLARGSQTHTAAYRKLATTAPDAAAMNTITVRSMPPGLSFGSPIRRLRIMILRGSVAEVAGASGGQRRGAADSPPVL
jgi:hypothetical protein